MQLRRFTILKGIVLSTSFVLTLFTFYSADVYIRVYEATRNFDVLTPEFKVSVLNSSYASTETTMTLLNPSRSRIELVQVIEGIHLNGEFITTERFSVSGRPVEIHPMSNTTITIKADVPPHRANYVTSRIERTWFIDVRITLSAEMVGTFPWRRTWLIADI